MILVAGALAPRVIYTSPYRALTPPAIASRTRRVRSRSVARSSGPSITPLGHRKTVRRRLRLDRADDSAHRLVCPGAFWWDLRTSSHLRRSVYGRGSTAAGERLDTTLRTALIHLAEPAMPLIQPLESAVSVGGGFVLDEGPRTIYQ